MADSRTAAREVQGQVLETVRRSQEVTLDAVRNWVDALGPLTSQLPAQPSGLISPEDVVSSAYDFAEQLLAAQRKFAEDVVSVTAPLTGWAESPARRAGSAQQ